MNPSPLSVGLGFDQIAAQTKPPRIPEPGLWGVVESHIKDDVARRWVNYGEGIWRNGYGNHVTWDELIDPELIREGLS